MENFNKFIDTLKLRTDNFTSAWGIIALVADCIIAILLIYLVYRILKFKFKKIKAIIFISSIIVLYALSYFLGLEYTLKVLKCIIFWTFGVIILVYSQEIKHILEINFHNPSSDSVFSSQEEKASVVEKIVTSAVYLSERRIGALITVERNDNLDSFIDKAIFIRGKITEELLTSLFYVGTATHDGAVIIRKNLIMCAGAYLPATDKYDVPKALGTRHRAAIGLSERYDAITVVVSEETGKISVTVDGIIQLDLTKEHLQELLEQYLISK